MPATPHILIAEDDRAIRDVLVRIVARLYPTATITAVATGADALVVAGTHRPDLVITDYRMPQMSGLAVLQALRAREATLPILIISLDHSIAEAVVMAGASGFVPKPFDLADLQQALITLLPP